MRAEILIHMRYGEIQFDFHLCVWLGTRIHYRITERCFNIQWKTTSSLEIIEAQVWCGAHVFRKKQTLWLIPAAICGTQFYFSEREKGWFYWPQDGRLYCAFIANTNTACSCMCVCERAAPWHRRCRAHLTLSAHVQWQDLRDASGTEKRQPSLSYWFLAGFSTRRKNELFTFGNKTKFCM